MASRFPEGILLESVCVAPQLQAQLDAAVEEAISSHSWLDAQTVLPAAIISIDAAVLLQQSVAAQSTGAA